DLGDATDRAFPTLEPHNRAELRNLIPKLCFCFRGAPLSGGAPHARGQLRRQVSADLGPRSPARGLSGCCSSPARVRRALWKRHRRRGRRQSAALLVTDGEVEVGVPAALVLVYGADRA